MNNRQRFQAIMSYENYDRMPVVHFGFWSKTTDKWLREGKITEAECECRYEGFPEENLLNQRLGFDFNFYTVLEANTELFPPFERTVLETTPDGFQKVLNMFGVIELHRGEAGSIPAEVGHLLTDRKSFEEHYRHRISFSEGRVPKLDDAFIRQLETYENPVALHCGSLFGFVRNLLGVEGSAYLYADDEELFTEIIDIIADSSYRVVESILKQTTAFSHAHFWEDICFKNGPLIIPDVFREKVGPHYKRVTELLHKYGLDIVSLDCDGMIDSLLPIWLENGVNTMFPIEVGTWDASIGPWREQYGKQLRGVGGMNKTLFAQDYAAIDREIERLKPLIALGGYIPCPDHRIAPDAIFENVQYYCDKMRNLKV